jgi:NTP pyrophosphatase (non-canonical NTP hydrolase)
MNSLFRPKRAPHGQTTRPWKVSEFAMNSLFQYFRSKNVERCNAAFGPHDDWSLTDWALAFIGEAGEICNEVKKLRRQDGTGSTERLATEIADAFTYLDLLAARANIDIWPAVVAKFNEVSTKRNCSILLKLGGEQLYMVNVNEVSGSVFVKDRDFFLAQGGDSDGWGKNWFPVWASSIEDAREKGCKHPGARPYHQQAPAPATMAIHAGGGDE